MPHRFEVGVKVRVSEFYRGSHTNRRIAGEVWPVAENIQRHIGYTRIHVKTLEHDFHWYISNDFLTPVNILGDFKLKGVL